MFSVPCCCTWAVSNWQQLKIILQRDYFSQDPCPAPLCAVKFVRCHNANYSLRLCDLLNLTTQSSLPKAWFYLLPDPFPAPGCWGLGTAPLEQSQSQHCPLFLRLPSPPTLLFLLSPATDTNLPSVTSLEFVSWRWCFFAALVSLAAAAFIASRSFLFRPNFALLWQEMWVALLLRVLQVFAMFWWDLIFPRKQANNTFQPNSGVTGERQWHYTDKFSPP